ncbi:MAG: twin transmembrane helix small protein [Rhodospirillales bacterium]|nr:twin transmembrane helix small protein [Rhodospirillales bacterium]
MRTFLFVVVLLLMAGVVGVLLTGMIGLVRGGGDPRRSNKLMQWRVALQAAALLVFILLLSLTSSS